MHHSKPISMTLRNFGSIGPQGMKFDFESGKVIGITGGNGTGKSTIKDGIRWLLTGSGRASLNNMVNWTSKQDASGKLIWEGYRGVVYIIERKIVIKGEKATQKLSIRKGGEKGEVIKGRSGTLNQYIIDNILGIPITLLDSLCLLDEDGFRGFAKMDASEFRKLVEASFNLERIAKMKKQAKAKYDESYELVQQARVSIAEAETNLKNAHDLIVAINKAKQVDDIRARFDSQIKTTKEEISSTRELIKEVMTEGKNTKVVLEKHQNGRDVELLRSKLSDMVSSLAVMRSNLSAYQKTLSFLEKHETCPTCKQVISASFRESEITNLSQKISELEAGIKQISNRITKGKSWVSTFDELSSEYQNRVREYTALADEGRNLSNKVKRLIQERDNISSPDEIKPPNISDLEAIVASAKSKFDKLSQDVNEWKLIRNLVLSDEGLKRSLLKRSVPILDRFSNTVLQSFSLNYLSIVLDDDMKVSIVYDGDNREFGNLSRGERFRVNVALLYGYILTVQELNGIRLPLHFLDEIFNGSLDIEGVHEFLSVVKDFAERNNIAAYVISHTLQEFVYDYEIRVTREGSRGYSEYIVLDRGGYT